jgi:glucose-1-phosphate thymidylyltransferase
MAPVTSAVILARGLGTRMRQADAGVALDAEQARAAESGMKGMIRIGRPFLDYVISALADAGIRRVCLVIGPEHDAVRDYYGREVRLSRVSVGFAIQARPLGTADAVAAAEGFVADERFLVLNADNYYPVEAYRALISLGESGLVGFEPEPLIAESNIDAERVKKFALVEVDANGYLSSIIEKPDDSTYARLAGRVLVSMNLWSFSPRIFDACRRVKTSSRGELELQDAVRIAVQELGERLRVVRYAGGVLDLSSRRDVEAVGDALRGRAVEL